MNNRQIVKIDAEKCNGCGQCIPSCAEGAIQIVDGKAQLAADRLCDGLGNCLGHCPQGAITIETRPADEFDQAAVERRLGRHHAPAASPAEAAGPGCNGGCPGSRLRMMPPAAHAGHSNQCPGSMARQLRPAVPSAQAASGAEAPAPQAGAAVSRLGHWPVQLGLVPAGGPLWQDADVLIAADCVPVAMPDFHERLLKARVVAIACPRLDETLSYVEKLAEIFAAGGVRSVTVARMEVPCCRVPAIVRQAMALAGRNDIPITEVTVGADGAVQSQVVLTNTNSACAGSARR